ncbi:hypothetical protein CHS0354_023306 [Potamilus streckersoni]|uniref:Uncharacterized protein n=1 Tax=Potamilus streckersoni TaxID=2493646 RepID=A0AAE0T5M3_9BIVA|nr:hypothetical protein CHS0354_023306 [Potamilus streckersoni]
MLLNSSNAGFFDNLKQSFACLGSQLSCAFQPVLASGQTLGTQLLAQAAQTGSTLAGQALSDYPRFLHLLEKNNSIEVMRDIT